MVNHECPTPGCHESVSSDRLACAKHWYMIPKPLRDQLWREWRHGRPTDSHAGAVAACVNWLEQHVEAAA